MHESVTRRQQWTVTVLLLLFMYINFADKAVIGLAAVPMMRELHLSPQQWGLVGSSFFFLFPVAALLVGFLVNRVPARWALAAMGLLWALTQFPLLGTASFGVLVACRVILGAGEGPAFPVALHAAYKWFRDEERTLPTSIIALGSALGVLSAAPVLVWLIERFGWRAAFALLGVAGLGWVALWLVFGKEGPLGGAAASDPVARSEREISYAALLTSRTMIGVLVTGFAAYWTLALLVAWVPAFLQQGLGYSVARSTVLIVLTWGAAGVLLPLVGWLAQRARLAGASGRTCRGIPAGVLVSASGALSVAALLLAPGALQIGLLVFGYSLGSAIFALGPALLGEIAPPGRRSAILGIATAIETVAGMIAPYATGRIIAAAATLHDGYIHAFVFAGALVLCGGIAGLALLDPEADRLRFARGGGVLAPGTSD